MRFAILLVLGWSCCFFAGIAVHGQDETAPTDPMRAINPDMPKKWNIDDKRVAAAGIRRLEGKHIILYTDIRDRPDIDELVKVFDQATEQWCELLDVEKSRTEPWKISVMLIGGGFPFRTAKLMPPSLPKFEAGINRGHEIWLYVQPGNYYTRHLLLHEGTHSFMQWFLGGSGPAWYSEGMAEMLALHEWKDGKLTLNFRVTSNKQAEFWGRPKKIRELRDENKTKTLPEIMAVEAIFAKEVENYAWSWAACEFFKRHPLTEKPFQELTLTCKDASARFSSRFLSRLEPVKAQVENDWKLFVHELDYGIQSDAIALMDVESNDKGIFTIQSDKSWQRTSIKVQKGDTLVVSAQGRYQIRETTKPWDCEPNGVTIDYYMGQPLGMLLMGISNEESVDSLLNPVGVGKRKKLVVEHDGVLCFRVNESTTQMVDNKGDLKVHVKHNGQ